MTASRFTSENQYFTRESIRPRSQTFRLKTLRTVITASDLRLLIKSAILMPSAKKDDINIVQIESEGYNKEKVLFCFCIQL